MAQEIDEKFDKWEKVVDRGSKLLIKIGTAVVGVILGLFVALEQLDYHIFDSKNQDSPSPETSLAVEDSLVNEIVFSDTLDLDTVELSLDTINN